MVVFVAASLSLGVFGGRASVAGEEVGLGAPAAAELALSVAAGFLRFALLVFRFPGEPPLSSEAVRFWYRDGAEEEMRFVSSAAFGRLFVPGEAESADRALPVGWSTATYAGG